MLKEVGAAFAKRELPDAAGASWQPSYGRQPLMQVKNVLSRFSDSARLGKSRDAADAATRNLASSSGAGGTASSSATAAKLRDVLTGYDVTNISPRSFSEMLQKLQQSSVVSDKELQELSQIRTDLDRDGVGADQRVNLVDIYTKKLQSAQQDAADLEQKLGTAGAQGYRDGLHRRLGWVEKFAAIHASPTTTAINAMA
jgi:hypothetical protein